MNRGIEQPISTEHTIPTPAGQFVIWGNLNHVHMAKVLPFAPGDLRANVRIELYGQNGQWRSEVATVLERRHVLDPDRDGTARPGIWLNGRRATGDRIDRIRRTLVRIATKWAEENFAARAQVELNRVEDELRYGPDNIARARKRLRQLKASGRLYSSSLYNLKYFGLDTMDRQEFETTISRTRAAIAAARTLRPKLLRYLRHYRELEAMIKFNEELDEMDQMAEAA